MTPERILAGARVAALVAGLYIAWRMYSAAKSVTDLPAQAVEYFLSLPELVKEKAAAGGSAWQQQYQEQPKVPGGTAYGQKYYGPLVNDDGMDFGQLSG